MGAYDQMKKAFQDLIAPEIHALRGDIRVVNERLVALDQKIDAVDARLTAKVEGVEGRLLEKIVALDQKVVYLDEKLTAKIDSLRNEMHSELRRVDNRIDSMDRDLRLAIDIRERLAVLEARRPA